MTTKLRIVLAQINLTVGDIAGNLRKHLEAAKSARDELHADVIVFPELSLVGYPPEDLLLRKSFIKESDAALQTCITEIRDIHYVIGHPHAGKHGLHNACSFIYNGSILCLYAKQRLPNYGVFDEDRYFKPGNKPCVVNIKGIPISVVICEDLWGPSPIEHAVSEGARIILSPNASPFEIDKHEKRVAILTKRTQKNKIPIVYVNHSCGQDELVFDGGSMVMDGNSTVCQFAGFFNEKLLPVDVHFDDANIHISKSIITLPSIEEKTYQALVTGVREYVNKNGFPGVLIGLSGGIDSALTLVIAVDALGHDRVHPIIMPSRHTTDISIEDALTICKNLNVKPETISIEPTYSAFLETLKPIFGDKEFDITNQNLQARCRGVILMALSNQSGAMVLSTGNRSELAVGYCTLYGDMVGGFNALKDVPKMLVYALSRYRNQIRAVIPQRVIDRPPTAELAPNQKDEDTLPPYSIFDKILYAYLNHGMNIEEIADLGFDKNVVKAVVKLVHKNEYKRRQASPGTRINHKSFIKDWRYPLTNKFKG